MINSISIGNITIHFYSLCILLGVIISYGLITKCTAKNKDKNSKNNFNSTFKYSRD